MPALRAEAAPSAQGAGGGLSVQGAILELTATPGQVYVHQMVIGNGSSSVPLDITVEARGFGQGLQGNYLPLTAADDHSPYSARTWITSISKPAFRLDPRTSMPVTATVTVPANLGPATYYAMIYIHSQPVTSPGAVAQIVTAGVPVIITPAGAQPVRTGKISELKVNPVESGKPVQVLVAVQNTGTRHFKYVGQVQITDPAGATLATLPLPQGGVAVFPTFFVQAEADYNPGDHPGGLAPGTYGVQAQVALDDGTFLDTGKTTFSVSEAYHPLPGIPDDQVASRTYKGETPGTFDARAKADVMVNFESTGIVTGTVYAGKYPQTPPGTPAFEAAPGDGGTGKRPVKFVGLRVDGFSNGVAHVSVFYRPGELGAIDPNSLLLAYREGSAWRKLDNLTVQTGAQSVRGDIPVSALGQAMAIGLGGDAGAGVAGGLLALWPIGLGVVGASAVVGISAGMVITRRKR